MYKNNFSRKIFWFISCSLYCDVMMPHFLLTDENREDKWNCLSLSLQSFLYQHSTLRSMRSVRVLGPLCCPNEPRLSKWFPKVLPFSTTSIWKFFWYFFVELSVPYPSSILDFPRSHKEMRADTKTDFSQQPPIRICNV